VGEKMNLDYKRLGLKVGLEVHQQIDSDEKLFCACKTKLFTEEPQITFLRALRPTQSELGQVDAAAFFEFQKGVKILYEASHDTSCLVEMDEEPPHELNREALEAVLVVSLLLRSNTTGFQRTCVIALGGLIKLGEKPVPIQHVGLEEDAARKMGGKGNLRIYRVDRLCIPLIEVATAPVLYTPEEAEGTALAIGKILRATNRVKRGLGTIRQDLNISIRDGALVEIKGVQELELISSVVRNEVRRQLSLLTIRDELAKRGVNPNGVEEEFQDITAVFRKTKCKVIRESIDNNKQVLAVNLRNFQGILKTELTPSVRFGTELADVARFWGRVGGIFHTDELPAYGITQEEVHALKRATNAGQDDAVVFVADISENAVDALKAVTMRAKEAIKTIPQETRVAKPDGSTRYMRPRPGSARMYPETDIPPIQISYEYLQRLHKDLPEMPEHRLQRLMHDHGLNRKLAKQVSNSEFSNLYDTVVKNSEISPTLVAVVLTETVKALKRDGVEVDLSDAQFLDLFRLVEHGKIAKEAISDIIAWLSKHRGATMDEAISTLGLDTLSLDKMENLIDTLIEKNRHLLVERGEKAFGFLMGLIMKRVRGKVDAEKVSNIVKRKLEDVL
jgi:glutamyl-tRNA(Gln) amidotransferase subunit E